MAISLSVISIMYSHIESAFAVLPFSELVGSSLSATAAATRLGCRGDLNPWPQRRRRAPSRTSRRSMKNPLIGSAMSA